MFFFFFFATSMASACSLLEWLNANNLIILSEFCRTNGSNCALYLHFFFFFLNLFQQPSYTVLMIFLLRFMFVDFQYYKVTFEYSSLLSFSNMIFKSIQVLSLYTYFNMAFFFFLSPSDNNTSDFIFPKCTKLL